jgi:hypothetical protein
MFDRRVVAMVVVAMVAWAMAGCSTPEIVPSKGPHAPTQASEVKIYQKEPKKYEELGLVQIPVGGDVKWDEHGDATAGFEKLRVAAAAKGANGLLLLDREHNKMMVVAGYKGTFYSVPVRRGTPDVAVAQAIWMLEEK